MKDPVKKLIIVCSDKSKPYANYLRQLISLKDDTEESVIGVKDGTVEVSVWTDKEYDQNSQTISSNMHVLFVGRNKVSKAEVSTMDIKFDKFGMHYGWLGKRGMLDVDTKTLSNKEYEEFIKYCTDYVKDIEMHSSNTKLMKISLLYGLLGATAAITPGIGFIARVSAIATGTSQGIKQMTISKKIHDQQFRALTALFYYDGISKFIEE